MKGLAGEVALVTGGSSGIGQAIAIRLGDEGVDVAINYVGRPEGAEETKAAIEHGVARSVPMSSWGPADDTGPTVDPDRFRGADDQYPRNWTPVGAPGAWQPCPEQSAVAAETRRLLGAALRELPDRQRTVVSLRDVNGLSSDEVCSLLDVSAANQRVLLHRGRAKLRAVLEHYYHSLEEVTS
jgi:RNA polymerase sigma factor (sigma-70 family)